MLKKLIILATCLFSANAYSQQCEISNARITSVHQYLDGMIFVNFDKAATPTGCGCQFPTRMGFHKNDNEKFLTAAALTGLAAGKTVTAIGEDQGCPIHGNTAKLIIFVVNAN